MSNFVELASYVVHLFNCRLVFVESETEIKISSKIQLSLPQLALVQLI